jgi:hypothetical protein
MDLDPPKKKETVNSFIYMIKFPWTLHSYNPFISEPKVGVGSGIGSHSQYLSVSMIIC